MAAQDRSYLDRTCSYESNKGLQVPPRLLRTKQCPCQVSPFLDVYFMGGAKMNVRLGRAIRAAHGALTWWEWINNVNDDIRCACDGSVGAFRPSVGPVFDSSMG